MNVIVKPLVVDSLIDAFISLESLGEEGKRFITRFKESKHLPLVPRRVFQHAYYLVTGSSIS